MEADINKDVVIITSEALKRIRSISGVCELFHSLQRFDGVTYLHSENVARLSAVIGRQLSLREDKLIDLAVSGYLHDIGKISLGIDIIGKPDKLTEEEYAEVKEHPRLGYLFLRPFIQDKDILSGVLEHHERLSGDGYIRGLQGKEISLFGRILGAADVFDAITSIRPYKKAQSCTDAIQMMSAQKGFDPDVVEVLKKIYTGGNFYDVRVLECQAWCLYGQSEFIPL